MAVLNDEQVMLRDMAREWADNERPVAAFRKLRQRLFGRRVDPPQGPVHRPLGRQVR